MGKKKKSQAKPKAKKKKDQASVPALTVFASLDLPTTGLETPTAPPWIHFS